MNAAHFKWIPFDIRLLEKNPRYVWRARPDGTYERRALCYCDNESRHR